VEREHVEDRETIGYTRLFSPLRDDGRTPYSLLEFTQRLSGVYINVGHERQDQEVTADSDTGSNEVGQYEQNDDFTATLGGRYFVDPNSALGLEVEFRDTQWETNNPREADRSEQGVGLLPHVTRYFGDHHRLQVGVLAGFSEGDDHTGQKQALFLGWESFLDPIHVALTGVAGYQEWDPQTEDEMSWTWKLAQAEAGWYFSRRFSLHLGSGYYVMDARSELHDSWWFVEGWLEPGYWFSPQLGLRVRGGYRHIDYRGGNRDPGYEFGGEGGGYLAQVRLDYRF
jgi:hypothetical protein